MKKLLSIMLFKTVYFNVGKFFYYTKAQTDYLSSKDPLLGRAIDSIGKLMRPINTDVFQSLVYHIISQQISAKAAQTVWLRLKALCHDDVSARSLLLPVKTIQSAGMTMKKAQYINKITDLVCSDPMILSTLAVKSDEEIIKVLSALPGIGTWTAEMILLHSLCRMNVLSFGDLAIRRGLCTLHGHDKINKAEFEAYRELYSPYGSVASIYLWKLSSSVTF